MIANIILFILLSISPRSLSLSLPVVLVHGIGSSDNELSTVSDYLSDKGLSVFNMKVGNGYIDSLWTSMPDQLLMLTEEIMSYEDLRDGFNIIGMSQGGLLARGYVQFTMPDDEFRVWNLITWVSPHGGVYNSDYPMKNIYTVKTQESESYSNYWRNPLPEFYPVYLSSSIYLPYLNAEKDLDEKSCERLNSLNAFVMVWSPNDDVLTPPESGKFSTFEYSDDGKLSIVPFNETDSYNNLCMSSINIKIHETDCNHKDHRNVECFGYLETYTLPFLV